MAFEILNAGLFATIQDSGRTGYMHLGVTPSGAMDMYAYYWVHTLLGEQSTNAIEAMTGLRLKAISNTTVAITGADLNTKLDGVKIPIWRSFYIKKGSVLSFDKRIDGMRVYIAVRGGFKIAQIRGSSATTAREGSGKVLKRGDILESNSSSIRDFRILKSSYIPEYNHNVTTLRLLPSYQYDDFPTESQSAFFDRVYEVTLQSNRMGYRLKGEAIKGTGEEILSEAIAFGAVQIPDDGQPIVLLSERQTIGGYPKIGVVLAEDCYRLAQLAPGAKVCFRKVTLHECDYSS
jgi:biotin-dependent carboxylase-like uncharacterized protein